MKNFEFFFFDRWSIDGRVFRRLGVLIDYSSGQVRYLRCLAAVGAIPPPLIGAMDSRTWRAWTRLIWRPWRQRSKSIRAPHWSANSWPCHWHPAESDHRLGEASLSIMHIKALRRACPVHCWDNRATPATPSDISSKSDLTGGLFTPKNRAYGF